MYQFLRGFKTSPIGLKILVAWIALTPLSLFVLYREEMQSSAVWSIGGAFISMGTLFIARGLLFKKRWARILTIAVSSINIISAFFTLFLMRFFFYLDALIIIFALPTIVGIGISFFIIWYLRRDAVRQLFHPLQQEISNSASHISGPLISKTQESVQIAMNDFRDRRLTVVLIILFSCLFFLDASFRLLDRVMFQVLESSFVVERYYRLGLGRREIVDFAILLFRGLFFSSLIISIFLAILVFNRKKIPEGVSYDERSGKGRNLDIPSEIGRWNWGAAGLGFIWGAYHRIWISLLGIIPVIGTFWWLVMGLRGNRWAWSANYWENVTEFKKSQRGAWSFLASFSPF